MPLPIFFPQLRNGAALIIFHGPVSHRAAYPVQKVPKHICAVLGVIDLRVKLHPVESPSFICNGHIRAGGCVPNQAESVGDLSHIVSVAHPADACGGQALEQGTGGVVIGVGFSVFPGGVCLGGSDQAA